MKTLLMMASLFIAGMTTSETANAQAKLVSNVSKPAQTTLLKVFTELDVPLYQWDFLVWYMEKGTYSVSFYLQYEHEWGWIGPAIIKAD